MVGGSNNNLGGSISSFAVENYELIVGLIGPLLIYALIKHRGFFLWSSIIKNQQQQQSHYQTPQGKAILITGADTGFGALFAACLVRMGYTVFACCLNATTATASKTFSDLKSWYGDSFHVVQMDVTNDEQISAARSTIFTWLQSHPTYRLFGIISNAGIAYPMVPVELCSIASFNNVMNINVYGALRVFQTFIPVIRSGQHQGDAALSSLPAARIVVISSLAGELTAPMMSAYCASKWALLAVSDTLRYEVDRFNISVSTILPDLYKTQLVLNKDILHASLDRELVKMNPAVLHDYGGIDQMRSLIDMMEAYASSDLSPVVNAVVDAMCNRKKPQRRYYPIGWQSSFVTTLARWCPSLLDNMVTVAVKYSNNKKQTNNLH